jgi:FUS-interacting serine-arginine-rich protein 1
MSKSIAIRFIGTKANEADLREIFGMFGGVRDIYLPKDFRSGAPSGRAFVEFCSSEEALAAAFGVSGLVLDGVVLQAELARGDRKSADSMRSRPLI